MQQEIKQVPLGGLKILKTNIIGEDKSNYFEIDFNKGISLFCGANGTGKTMILILNWIVNNLATAILETGKSKEQYEKFIKEFMDGSFEKNDFTGEISGVFEYMDISFKLTDGKVSDLKYEIKPVKADEKLVSNGMSVFMSKNTRLFTDVDRYIKTKKMLGITSGLQSLKPEELAKLGELYKLYDILFVERMLYRLSSPTFEIHETLKEFCKTDMKMDLQSIFYDEKKGIIEYTKIVDGKPITNPITTLSSGEQAWINMSIQH